MVKRGLDKKRRRAREKGDGWRRIEEKRRERRGWITDVGRRKGKVWKGEEERRRGEEEGRRGGEKERRRGGKEDMRGEEERGDGEEERRG